MKCLEKVASRRYQSAEQFANDLEAWAHGGPVTARPLGHLEIFGRWCRSHPFVIAAYVVLVVVLTFYLVWGWFNNVRVELIIIGVGPVVILFPLLLVVGAARDLRLRRQTLFATAMPDGKTGDVRGQEFVTKARLELWMKRWGFAFLMASLLISILSSRFSASEFPTTWQIFWQSVVFWLAGSGLGAALAAGLIKWPKG